MFKYENDNFIKLKCLNSQKEVYQRGDIISFFGDNGDLYLCNDCNIIKNSFSQLGCNNSYTCPTEIEPNSIEAR